MLAFRLGCNTSGYHRNSHITKPQLTAANTGHAFPVNLSFISGDKPNPPALFRCTLYFAIPSSTLAKT